MKKVILVRHAKSSWADPDTEDHDRPLAPRGIAAAPVIGAWLAERGHLPDAVLCSSSLRTRQTYERLHKALPGLPAPSIEPGLYHANAKSLLARLARLERARKAAMVIGHQPGLGSLARKLARTPVPARCVRAFKHFPTAAAAVLVFEDEDWSEIAFDKAAFIDFAMPRELVAS
ncbi:MAG: histidine phosphatase family protein [Pseudomonadota bacterium]